MNSQGPAATAERIRWLLENERDPGDGFQGPGVNLDEHLRVFERIGSKGRETIREAEPVLALLIPVHGELQGWAPSPLTEIDISEMRDSRQCVASVKVAAASFLIGCGIDRSPGKFTLSRARDLHDWIEVQSLDHVFARMLLCLSQFGLSDDCAALAELLRADTEHFPQARLKKSFRLGATVISRL
ncbi:MAG: hypothetical protein KGO02_15065 [Alphaproteobacteria bacterium]|nr:hypothetical protein [Alphaproteobacteria bacterium]